MGLKDNPQMELLVTVYNVNEGRNSGILSKCETLKEYASFISVVRQFVETEKNLNDAMKKAVIYSIDHGILINYLKKHSTEVINMLLTEWNTEKAIEIRSKEAWDDATKVSKTEDVTNLFDYGMSTEQISQALKLPMEQVQQYLQTR
ncbi:MAG: hypothetical protein LBM77_03370 [Spirochaetaceae bacterium]|nr:hypothetical protein [Spirochaetaceae bacterium]